MRKSRGLFIIVVLGTLGAGIYYFLYQDKILRQIIGRLTADSRVAEVLVTSVTYNEAERKNYTAIKFLEYDSAGNPLEAKYFSFPGNIIQFQALVVRFDDKFVMAGDLLKGKSVYLFWKAFMLDGPNTKEFIINPLQDIPGGYKLSEKKNAVEEKFWRKFWDYAFAKDEASKAGIKNVQIEAPGSMFIPGYLYTITIEHDGGLRIDTASLPAILRGETVPK